MVKVLHCISPNHGTVSVVPKGVRLGVDKASQPGAAARRDRRQGKHVVERCQLLLKGSPLPSKRAEPVAGALTAALQTLPPACRKTVTFDNGTEFARHYELGAIGIDTYFCDPHAPWQKGGIENAIGRMRRFLPRKTDLATLDSGTLLGMMAAYNNTPRKCLGFQTPAEAFSQQVLHFKCESTPPLSPT